MNRDNEGLARLLADSTRMKIYEAVAEARGEPVTVAEIAESFGLHVNVARMHLEKLANAGLLASRFRKRDGGGRPAREYVIGEKVINCQFPPRDYELLADIALASLSVNTRSRNEAWQRGREIGSTALAKAGMNPDVTPFGELLKHFEQLTHDLGLYASITAEPDGTIDMKIFNCVFKELSAKHMKKICLLHQNMLIGLCESYFGKVRVKARSGIIAGKANCGVQISVELEEKASPEGPG